MTTIEKQVEDLLRATAIHACERADKRISKLEDQLQRALYTLRLIATDLPAISRNGVTAKMLASATLKAIEDELQCTEQ